MFIYKIVLELNLPLDIWEYRTAHAIHLQEALWIYNGFPFEEPTFYEAYPEDGPAPNILYANLKNQCFLIVQYEGNGIHNLLLAESNGQFHLTNGHSIREVKNAIEVFWRGQKNYKQLYRDFSRRLDWFSKAKSFFSGSQSNIN